MFILYNVIHKQKTASDYSLIIQFCYKNKIKNLIIELIYVQLVVTAIKIKKANKCINLAILVLKTHI